MVALEPTHALGKYLFIPLPNSVQHTELHITELELPTPDDSCPAFRPYYPYQPLDLVCNSNDQQRET